MPEARSERERAVKRLCDKYENVNAYRWPEFVRDLYDAGWDAALAPAVSTPPQEGQLQHARNCPERFRSDDDCTCGLQWRIYLQTEQAMSAAWRKRAEEAEAKLSGAAVSTPRCPKYVRQRVEIHAVAEPAPPAKERARK